MTAALPSAAASSRIGVKHSLPCDAAVGARFQQFLVTLGVYRPRAVTACRWSA